MPRADETDEFILIIREIGGVDHLARGAFEGQMAQTQAEDADTQIVHEGLVVDGVGEDPEHRDDRHQGDQGDQGEDGDGLAGERRHGRQDRRDGRPA